MYSNQEVLIDLLDVVTYRNVNISRAAVRSDRCGT